MEFVESQLGTDDGDCDGDREVDREGCGWAGGRGCSVSGDEEDEEAGCEDQEDGVDES